MQKKNAVNIAEIYNDFLAEFHSTFPHYWKQLRYCSADVGYTRHFFVLRSYTTNVAFIDRRTGICYDVLRAVYGYTATSSQHIRKFAEDYRAIKTIRIDSHNQLIYTSQDE